MAPTSCTSSTEPAAKLDWNRILHLVGEHWMVLLWALVLYQYIYPAHSEFVPRALWDELLSRLRNELDHPNPHAAFSRQPDR